MGWLVFMYGVFKKGSVQNQEVDQRGFLYWFLVGYSGERMKSVGMHVLVE